MKTYEPWSLSEFINKLESLGEAEVRGFDGHVFSYRGYYERNCTEPCDRVENASTLAAEYRGEIGKSIEGYKGGDYTVSASELIYYVEYGRTGPALCGLEPAADGVFEPVGVVENFW